MDLGAARSTAPSTAASSTPAKTSSTGTASESSSARPRCWALQGLSRDARISERISRIRTAGPAGATAELTESGHLIGCRTHGNRSNHLNRIG